MKQKREFNLFRTIFFIDLGTLMLYFTILGIIIWYFRIYTENLTSSFPDTITGITLLIIISWSTGLLTLIIHETYLIPIKKEIKNETKKRIRN